MHDARTAELTHAAGHAHPGPRTYVVIAVVLSVITAIEVTIYYVEALRGVLVPTLLLLSAAKFVLVVGFYMHLKFDATLYRGFFGAGLLIAASVIIAFVALFGNFSPPLGPPPDTTQQHSVGRASAPARAGPLDAPPDTTQQH